MINEQQIKLIAKDLARATQIVSAKHGVVVDLTVPSEEKERWQISLLISAQSRDDQDLNEQARAFLEHASEHDLRPEDLGREFLMNGEKWTLYGLNVATPRYPIVATKLSDGRNYKLRAAAVKLALERTDTEALGEQAQQ